MKTNQKRVVVVTGASSGLGRATYKFFEEMGDIAVSLSRSNPENFANFFECDVTNREQVEDVFLQVFAKFGKIDILINNAGVATSGALELENFVGVKSTFDVNVLGVINCYQCALMYMKAGGKIINISSICAPCPVPFRAVYSASKSAVTALSYCEYMELKASKISAVCITLGQTKTDLEKHRQNTSATNERYGTRAEKNINDLKKDQSKRQTAESVAKTLYKISCKKAPKPMYVVGRKYKFVYFLSKILPTKTFLNITNKFLF